MKNFGKLKPLIEDTTMNLSGDYIKSDSLKQHSGDLDNKKMEISQAYISFLQEFKKLENSAYEYSKDKIEVDRTSRIVISKLQLLSKNCQELISELEVLSQDHNEYPIITRKPTHY